jgi:hypothetical protein
MTVRPELEGSGEVDVSTSTPVEAAHDTRKREAELRASGDPEQVPVLRRRAGCGTVFFVALLAYFGWVLLRL